MLLVLTSSQLYLDLNIHVNAILAATNPITVTTDPVTTGGINLLYGLVF